MEQTHKQCTESREEGSKRERLEVEREARRREREKD
jgi:hypothetical protein